MGMNAYWRVEIAAAVPRTPTMSRMSRVQPVTKQWRPIGIVGTTRATKLDFFRDESAEHVRR
jgi:hypothetical protein